MQINNITVISLAGQMDQQAGEQLDGYLKDQVLKGNLNFILDFRNVNFTSPGELRILLGIIKNTRSKGGDIFIINTSLLLINLLETSGLLNLLKVFTDVDSAIMNLLTNMNGKSNT